MSELEDARPPGLRLHNPGLLPVAGVRWQGALKPAHGEPLVRFQAPQFGIAAIGKTLLDFDRAGKNTVWDIVEAWPLPPGAARLDIVAAVAKAMAVDPGDWLDLDDYATAESFTKALIFALNGRQPYKDVTLAEGLRRGRIHNAPQKPLWRQSGFTLPTLFAGLNATALLGGLAEGLKGIASGLAPFSAIPELRMAAIAFVGLNTVLGLVLMVGKLRKQQKGLN